MYGIIKLRGIEWGSDEDIVVKVNSLEQLRKIEKDCFKEYAEEQEQYLEYSDEEEIEESYEDLIQRISSSSEEISIEEAIEIGWKIEEIEDYTQK